MGSHQKVEACCLERSYEVEYPPAAFPRDITRRHDKETLRRQQVQGTFPGVSSHAGMTEEESVHGLSILPVEAVAVRSREIGSGVRAAATMKVFTAGELQNTARPLDIAITGDGFLQVTMPNGDLRYTRDGSLMTNSNG